MTTSTNGKKVKLNDFISWLEKEIEKTSSPNGHNILKDKCAKGICIHFSPQITFGDKRD
jgi:hypothetical protein